MTMHDIRKLRGWSLRDWRLAARSLILLSVVSLMLGVAGYKRTDQLLRRFYGTDLKSRRRPLCREPASAQPIWRMVSIIARRGPVKASCLAQAMVIRALLAESGVESTLKLGVRKAGGNLLAHAWVVAGEEVFDSEGGSYDYHVLAAWPA